MDDIPVKEYPVFKYKGKLPPSQVWMLLLQLLQRIHIGGNSIVISQNDHKLAIRMSRHRLLDM